MQPSNNRSLSNIIRLLVISALILSWCNAPLHVAAQSEIHLIIDQTDSQSFPEIWTQVSVLDSQGLPIAGLGADNFAIFEGALGVTNLLVTPTYEHPLDIAVAIDLSNSMGFGDRPTPLENSLAATKEFLATLAPLDRVGVITFSDQVNLAQDLDVDKSGLPTLLDELSPQGNTALHDGIVQAVDLLSASSRPVLILLSDGVDSGISEASMEQAIAAAVDNSVVVYPIAWSGANRADLQKLADRTRGELSFINEAYPDFNAIRGAFSKIESALPYFRLQYKLRYASALPADGQVHQLTVRVEHLGRTASADDTFMSTLGVITITLPDFTAGQQVGGLITFAPEISAPSPVDRLDILLDGAPLASVPSEPFEYTWDSTGILPGEHEFVFQAIDRSGNSGQASITLAVVAPISVEIISPEGGSTTTGPTLIAAQVTSLSRIAKVEFRVNDRLVETLVDPPYEYTWNATGAPAGGYEAVVLASDVNGFTSQDMVRFHVSSASNTVFPFGVALALALAAALVAVAVGMRARRQKQKASFTQPPSAPPGLAAPTARLDAAAPAMDAYPGIPMAPPPLSPEEAARAVLVEYEGLNPDQMWALSPSGETRLGRKRDENDIPLKGLTASRRQAIIRFQNGVYHLFSLKTENPALVNGIPVTQGQPLNPGDKIQAGESVFQFEIRG